MSATIASDASAISAGRPDLDKVLGKTGNTGLVAMGTTFGADHLGLPVPTTHVLSSGVAGTMAANKSGLQMSTIRNPVTAWVPTLPVSIALAGGPYIVSSQVL